jgi:hypothetical protein
MRLSPRAGKAYSSTPIGVGLCSISYIELRRIPLPRSWVNKDKKRGAGALRPGPTRGLANLTHTFVPATLESRDARSPPG